MPAAAVPPAAVVVAAMVVAVVVGPEGQQRRPRPSPGRLSEESPVLMIDLGALGS